MWFIQKRKNNNVILTKRKKIRKRKLATFENDGDDTIPEDVSKLNKSFSTTILTVAVRNLLFKLSHLSLDQIWYCIFFLQIIIYRCSLGSWILLPFEQRISMIILWNQFLERNDNFCMYFCYISLFHYLNNYSISDIVTANQPERRNIIFKYKFSFYMKKPKFLSA